MLFCLSWSMKDVQYKLYSSLGLYRVECFLPQWFELFTLRFKKMLRNIWINKMTKWLSLKPLAVPSWTLREWEWGRRVVYGCIQTDVVGETTQNTLIMVVLQSARDRHNLQRLIQTDILRPSVGESGAVLLCAMLSSRQEEMR